MNTRLVGFIGIGTMGKPMAINLLNAGIKLKVYDLCKEPLKELKNHGAQLCNSIEELAKESNVIITMLPNSPESIDVIIGKNGIINYAKPDTIVIDMGSIDPLVSIEIGNALYAKKIKFLDAPVSGGVPKAVDGTLAIMVGGDLETYKKVTDLFEILGNSHILIGGIGSGNYTKLANQIIVALNIIAVSEAFTLAQKAGLSPVKVFEAIRTGLAGSTVMEQKLPMILSRNFKPGFKIKLHRKDIQNVINASSKLDVVLPFTSLAFEVLKALDLDDKGNEDHNAIIKFFENISKVVVRNNT
ncbi:MAG: 2-hydroxy-3-oxopropionate reductase [Actinobacteria bacterium]|nr:2-hydroxy-3-oxopropionate reductase [Actinomycetota bacterium]MBU4449737.1 2-hydroxy-3-oxopropionate reductase [Actinomycetota bacterium]